ncbi:MAG: ATP-grasp domain-containing protein [Lachnospiraceae bacterium]|nr:ATP-grasp domain-containing protein [Lachnospiraceae bacterium]
MKKMLIPGAGIYQVPLIRKAKELGIYTIAASIPGPYPGFAFADETLYIDTVDAQGLLKAARERRIDGILTTGTDVAMQSVGLICDELGLPGISLSAAKILTDKAAMKEAFLEGGVRTAPFRKVFSLEEAEEAFLALGGPLMVKVTDKSGSRGVVRVDSLEALAEAYSYAASFTDKNYLIVEKYVEGHEIGIDAYVKDGRLALFLPHDKLIYRGRHSTVPVGHVFPCEGSARLLADMREQTERIAAVSGINDAALNIDALVSGDETTIIEAGGRCGATCIPELISLYGGIDYYGLMIKNALGAEADFSLREAVPCAASLLFLRERARLLDIDREGLMSLSEEGIYASFDYAPGAELPAMVNGTDRIGQVYGRGRGAEAAEAMAEKALSCLSLAKC